MMKDYCAPWPTVGLLSGLTISKLIRDIAMELAGRSEYPDCTDCGAGNAEVFSIPKPTRADDYVDMPCAPDDVYGRVHDDSGRSSILTGASRIAAPHPASNIWGSGHMYGWTWNNVKKYVERWDDAEDAEHEAELYGYYDFGWPMMACISEARASGLMTDVLKTVDCPMVFSIDDLFEMYCRSGEYRRGDGFLREFYEGGLAMVDNDRPIIHEGLENI